MKKKKSWVGWDIPVKYRKNPCRWTTKAQGRILEVLYRKKPEDLKPVKVRITIEEI